MKTRLGAWLAWGLLAALPHAGVAPLALWAKSARIDRVIPMGGPPPTSKAARPSRAGVSGAPGPAPRKRVARRSRAGSRASQSTAQTPNLTGTWQGEQHFQRGQRQFTLHSTYILQANGNRFDGQIISDRGRLRIVNGIQFGPNLSFQTRDDFRTHAPQQSYAATISHGTLTVHRLPPLNRPAAATPPPPLILRKTSPATVYHLPAALQHAPLPPLRALPWNGLAATPPMGWNSWNKFHGSVNDADVRATADELVKTGMAKAGYVYVNIDDTWEGQRDAAGNIQSNRKFPDMKALADYVHSKGLKLGIYSSPGPKTCAGYTGSYQHEAQDAATYARWGIDYLKYDWCSASEVYSPREMPQVYEKMALALRATGRPIVFSLCQYGWEDVWRWGAEVGGNLWRTTGDISDNYASMAANGFSQNGHAAYAQPGHWNDPDMLEIGNGGMSDTEYETHMSLWAILAAPLLAGNDLTKMTPDIRSILTNREVIAIDQDPLGLQGSRVTQDGPVEVWKRPLAGGAMAVGLFNRGNVSATIAVQWAALGLPGHPARVRDLWNHQNLKSPGGYRANVPAHGVVLLRVTP